MQIQQVGDVGPAEYRILHILISKIDMLNAKSIAFVIGPEGGIDDSERELLIKKGFVPVSLGDNILRTETAGLAVMSIIMYHLEIGE